MKDEPITPDESDDILGVLEDCTIYIVNSPRMRVQWRANMTVCCDGSGGNPDDDLYFQAQTAYYNNGKYLNPYEVPYIVVPPMIRYGVDPVVMGCQGVVLNLENGLCTPAIVGDEGPADKIGEASVEAARRCGLSGNPNSGGTDASIIAYVIWPGIPAKVDGITYKLQPS